MKLKLPRSKTENIYKSNKYMFDLSGNNIYNNKSKPFNLKKNLKMKSLSYLDEEYFLRLKYKLSENNSMTKNKKNLLFGDFQLNSIFPLILKNPKNIANIKSRRRRSIFLKENNTRENKLRQSKYGGKLENIYKENALENKREEIENKIDKLKGIMEPLSSELSKTLKQIDNYQLELEIIKNYNFTEGKFKKKYLSQKKSIINSKTNNNENTNLSSNNSNSNEKMKPKEIESLIKLQKLRIQKRNLEITHKLESLIIKKDNILIRLDSCEKNMKDLKSELKIVKTELIKHYHKLLYEGKDTRNEGLSWIIRSIWKLKINVIMSYLPKFLDQKSIEFLFKYSDKLNEMEQIQKNIAMKNDYLKKIGKRIGKLSEKLLQYEEIKDNNNLVNNDENEKSETNIIDSPKREKRKITTRTPSVILLKNIRRRNMLMTELTPINALKRLLSDADMPGKFKKYNHLVLKDNNMIQEKESSESSKSSKFSSTSKMEEETFKTSLYNDPKKSFKNLNFKMNKQRNTSNKILQNLELMLDNPNYLEQLTSHLAPTKTIKISDYENIKNSKIEDLYDSDLVKIFNEHKNLLHKLKEKKKEAEKFMRNELDRIGKCFYLEDYSGKYNTDLKTVIGALIGEDNVKLEVFRLQREQKEYFKTLKNLRTFNLLRKKII